MIEMRVARPLNLPTPCTTPEVLGRPGCVWTQTRMENAHTNDPCFPKDYAARERELFYLEELF